MRKLYTTLLIALTVNLNAQMVYPGDVTITGAEEVVFDYTTDNCSGQMSVDGCPQFFRDADGTINCLIPHPELFRLTGPDFDNLTVDCSAAVMESDMDPDPGDFNYMEWLSSTWTDDGETVYGLVHNEWHGYDFDGECLSTDVLKCWYNGLTLVESVDSGRTFTHATAPDHLVMSVPYEYDASYVSRQGAFGPSNIVKNPNDDYYYCLFYTEENINGTTSYLQGGGTCVMRTDDLSDPDSWRVYDGDGYNTEKVNPYTDTFDVNDHLLINIGLGKQMASLSYNTYFDQWMLVGPSYKYDVEEDEYFRGFYYQLSDDLVNWTGLKLIMRINFPDNSSQNSNLVTHYGMYPTVIDHEDDGMNFMYTGRNCYLYYTIWNTFPTESSGSANRDLRRIPIEFDKAYVSEFTITGRGSQYDANPGDGVCATESGLCSVNAAFQESNARLPKYADSLLTINFDVNGTNFNMANAGGSATYPMFFDGWTQPGSTTNTLSIEEGFDTGFGIQFDLNGNPGFTFEGGQSGMRGIAIKEYQGQAITFSGKGENVVEGCFIGTPTDGLSNTVEGNGYGVDFIDCDNNRMGGSDVSQHNLIVGGIGLNNSNGNTIQGNYCSLTADGTTQLSNDGNLAISLVNSSENLIGGETLEARNVFAGGYNRAISFENESNNNEAYNNYIGIDPTATTALGSYNCGVYFSQSGNNVVGNEDYPNVFGSTSTGVGTVVLESGAANNHVQYNLIGTDPSGTVDLLSTDGANQGGIYLSNDCENNIFSSNVITNCNNHGILTNGATLEGNTFSQNLIWNNGGMGIDIYYNNMADENDQLDEDTGPNSMQNHPELTMVTLEGDQVTFFGTLHSSADDVFTIECFASEACDPSGFGEGQVYLGSIEATTDASGDVTFGESFDFEGDSSWSFSATATSSTGNTSEFCGCLESSVPEPDIALNPEHMSATTPLGQDVSEEITITNDGSLDLTWSLSDDMDWLTASSTSGTIAPGESITLTVDMLGSTLTSGDYTGTITITSNDPDQADMVIDVTLSVTDQPYIEYSPGSFAIEQAPDIENQHDIEFTNTGSGELDWWATAPPPDDWIFVTGNNSGSLDAGQSTTLDVNIDSYGLEPGEYSSEVTISSNATNEPFVLIPVNLTVSEGMTTPVVELFIYEYDWCPGEEAQFDFQVTGPVEVGNVYTLEISDQTGNFDVSYPLGVYSTNDTYGTLECTIPTDLETGNGYRIRLRMNSPYSVGENMNDLTLHPMVDLTVPELPLTCVSTGFVNLPAGDPEGGIWYGEGVTNAQFFPPTVGIGTYNLEYIYTSPEGCTFKTTAEIEVVDQPTISMPTAGPFCANSVGQVLEASPGGGYWYGEGMEGTVFQPMNVGAGEFEVSYVYSLNESCTAQESITIEVFDLPDVWMSDQVAQCQGSGAVSISGGLPEGGDFWGDFVEDGMFDTEEADAGMHEISYTYTSEEGCSNTAIGWIEIAAAPMVELVQPDPLCTNDEPYDLDVNPDECEVEGEGIMGTTFYPALAGVGTHTITCSATSEEGCTTEASIEIVVNEVPDVTLADFPSLCQSDVAIPLDGGSPAGGLYTINGTIANEIDPESLAVGSHEVTYFYESDDYCMGIASESLEILENPMTPTVTFDGVMLSSSSPTNNQWYVDGVIIAGATDQTLMPDYSGNYSCVVIVNGCSSAESNSVNVTITNIGEMVDQNIIVYPNPFIDKIIIDAGEKWPDNTEIRMYSEAGQLVHFARIDELNFMNGKYIYGEGTLSNGFNHLSKGMYYLVMVKEGVVNRAVVQKGE